VFATSAFFVVLKGQPLDFALGNAHTEAPPAPVRTLAETALVATLSGNTAAFDDFVRRHQDRLFYAVHRLVETSEDAADVVQDAFVRAFINLESFRGDSNLYTWVYRIAYHLVISQKRKKRPVVSLDDARGPDPVDTSDGVHPGEAIERQEDKAGLYAALDSLSPGYRDLLVMRDLDGLRYDEIAHVLAVPIGTVRSRLHRARLELRQLLNPGWRW
jgi:RNA polymerase sigma-70 factor, ECF subfamily